MIAVPRPSRRKPPRSIFRSRHRAPAYAEKVMAAMQQHPEKVVPGTLNHVTIAHDEWCAIFKGGACNCDPDVTLLGETPP